MSKDFSNFIPDEYSEGQSGVSQKFNLDEYVLKAKALKSEFIHDLQHQREADQSKILQAGEVANELVSDAMQKMKDEAAKIREEAREKGHQEGHEEGYQAGAQAVRERFTSSMDAVAISRR